MVKVITYGTYDMLHYGHIRLLERAKSLGDFLIVGVTSDAYDKERGKINGTQSLLERVEAIKKTGLADMIIIEEYDGQKIEDIIKYDVDIFTVGSDWKGKFDYLEGYCKVVYLDRTEGISSSDIRSENKSIRIGIKGETTLTYKFKNECSYVNGVTISGLCIDENDQIESNSFDYLTTNYEELLCRSDAIYIVSHPNKHYEDVKKALLSGKHVICETPIANSIDQFDELIELAHKNNLVLMDSIKTAYSQAYQRLILLLKTGKIGEIISIDATCSSLKEYNYNNDELLSKKWGSYNAWGPTALLPVFQLLGCFPIQSNIVCRISNEKLNFDTFTKIDLTYNNSVASIKVGNGVKSEGEMIITGTKGYAYIPAPWWKTEYFELRYESMNDTKKYYFRIDGEGIRYEIVAFLDMIINKTNKSFISNDISKKFVEYNYLIRNKKYTRI